MADKFNAAFWKWFGDSKVVDAKGEPLVVYHGTGNSFDKFSKKKCGLYSHNKYQCPAFFFASDPSEASAYAQAQASHPSSRANVMPVYLSIQHLSRRCLRLEWKPSLGSSETIRGRYDPKSGKLTILTYGARLVPQSVMDKIEGAFPDAVDVIHYNTES